MSRRLKPLAWTMLIAVTLAIMFEARAVTAEITGVPSVIDGDTLEIRGERIRLHGIDAPEGRQLCVKPTDERWRCGQRAALMLADLIDRRPVRCEGDERDRYGRLIAVCYLGNLDLNRWMVENGWAVAFRRYSLDYVEAENEATAAYRGIWSSGFVMPWDWRRGQRLTEIAGGDGCTIKGNLNSKGDRIYHLPGQENYEQTVISPSKGERWFCSEDEARAAGWRRAQR